MMKEQDENYNSRIKKKRILMIVSAIMIFLLGGALILCGYLFKNLEPLSTEENLKILEIPLNSNVKEVAIILEKNKIIKDSNTFYYYTRYKGETDLRAGKYQLSPHMEIDQIIDILTNGKVFVETVKVTIPEGFNVVQIAKLLEKKGLVNEEEFIKAANKIDYEDVWFLNNIPNRDEVKYKLEGFLFPKTYIVREDAPAEDIVLMLLKQTENEFPKEWLGELKKRGISFYDAIILASIIEREAVADGERPKIAQVYYNRIKDGMKLQADATIQYAFGEQKERLLYSDLEFDSKYNTYKYKGMPPGPISNPGIEAIKAAVFPEKHGYLFYVTKKNGTGEHYFSKTYKQHQKNIELSKKNQ